jgi:hypothetical protein
LTNKVAGQEIDRFGGNDGLDYTDGHGSPLRGDALVRGYVSIKFQYDADKQPTRVIGGVTQPDPTRRINVATVTVTQTREGYDFDTSDLVNPYGADAAWLPWLAMLIGTRLDLSMPIEDQRDTIVNGFMGIKAGTKESMARMAQRYLTGSRTVAIFDHTYVDPVTGSYMPGGQWDVVIATRDDEMPMVSDGSGGFVQMSDAAWLRYLLPWKPAGVTLRRIVFESSWDMAVGKSDVDGSILLDPNGRVAQPGVFPYWVNWNNAIWRSIERAGLDR